jgi:hypothetical protein
MVVGLGIGAMASRQSEEIHSQSRSSAPSAENMSGQPQLVNSYQDSLGNVYTHYVNGGVDTYTITDSNGTMISSGTGKIVAQDTGHGYLYIVVPDE